VVDDIGVEPLRYHPGNARAAAQVQAAADGSGSPATHDGKPGSQ